MTETVDGNRPYYSCSDELQLRFFYQTWDLDRICEIERESFPDHPWTKHDFSKALSSNSTIAFVAELNHEVIAFLVYEVDTFKIDIINIAVAEKFRRRGVGTALVNKIKEKLNTTRDRINIILRETNTVAQLFFKSQEFQCWTVVKDLYDEINEDAYVMTYFHPLVLTDQECNELFHGTT